MVLARPFARIDGSPEGGPTRSTESAKSVDRVDAVGLTELTKSVDRSRRVGLTEFVRSVHRVARVGLTEVAKRVGGRRGLRQGLEAVHQDRREVLRLGVFALTDLALEGHDRL